jgi:hypothetical protein
MTFFTIYTSLRTFAVEAASPAEAKLKAAFLTVEGEEFLEVGRKPLTVMASEQDARNAFADLVADEDYRDNFRLAYADDESAMAEYERQSRDGCCGSADVEFMVGGRLLLIGCNYGH